MPCRAVPVKVLAERLRSLGDVPREGASVAERPFQSSSIFFSRSRSCVFSEGEGTVQVFM